MLVTFLWRQVYINQDQIMDVLLFTDDFQIVSLSDVYNLCDFFIIIISLIPILILGLLFSSLENIIV